MKPQYCKAIGIRRAALLVFLLHAIMVSSQNATLDSLQYTLKTYPKNDMGKVDLLNNVATKIYTSDADKALKLLGESAALAATLHYAKGEAYSLLYSGNAYLNKAEYKLALGYVTNSLEIYERLDDNEGRSNCYFNFGRSYFYLGDYDTATDNYKKAITLCHKTGDQKRLSASLVGLGVIYSKQGNHTKSHESYEAALLIDIKIGNKRGVSNILTNLANLYKKEGDYVTALEYYNKSLNIKKELGDQSGIAATLENIGNTYNVLGKGDDAYTMYLEALQIFEKTNNKQGILTTMTNAGVVFLNSDAPSRAMDFFQKAKRISEDIKDPYGIAYSMLNIGTLKLKSGRLEDALADLQNAVRILKPLNSQKELCYGYLKIATVYRLWQQYDTALQYVSKSAAIANELKLIDQQKDIALLRSEIHYDTQQYKLAYEDMKSHKQLKDSMFKAENFDKAAQVKYSHKFRDSLDLAHTAAGHLKKTLHKVDGELQTSEQQKILWIGGSICLLAILGSAVLRFRIRRRKMMNMQLATQQKLLRSQMNPHFIFNSIDNVQSLIYNKQDQDAVDYLNKFSKLTRQILESSNEDYISLQDEIDMLGNYLTSQQLLHGNKFSHTIHVDDSVDIKATFLPPMLTQPYVENAIKHGLSGKQSGGIINVNFLLRDSRLYFEVSDNGKGFLSPSANKGKSLSMAITKKRLVHYTKDQGFIIHTDNIRDDQHKVAGAKVLFEIPYICEN
ncbi:MAG TPA: tetratricopeptide repeat protein [Flavobacterium sp.]